MSEVQERVRAFQARLAALSAATPPPSSPSPALSSIPSDPAPRPAELPPANVSLSELPHTEIQSYQMPKEPREPTPPVQPALWHTGTAAVEPAPPMKSLGGGWGVSTAPRKKKLGSFSERRGPSEQSQQGGSGETGEEASSSVDSSSGKETMQDSPKLGATTPLLLSPEVSWATAPSLSDDSTKSPPISLSHAPIPTPPRQPSPPHSTDKCEHLHRALTDADATITQNETKIEAQSKELQAARELIQGLVSTAQKLQPEHDAALKRIASLESAAVIGAENIRSLESEADGMREKIALGEVIVPNVADVAKTRIEVLEKEVFKLKEAAQINLGMVQGRIVESEGLNAELTAAKGRVAELESESDALRKEVVRLTARVASQSSIDMERMVGRISEVVGVERKKVVEAYESLAKMHARVKELEDELSRAKDAATTTMTLCGPPRSSSPDSQATTATRPETLIIAQLVETVKTLSSEIKRKTDEHAEAMEKILGAA